MDFSKEDVMDFNNTIFENVEFGLYKRKDRAGNITLKLKDKRDKNDKVGLYLDFFKTHVKILISSKNIYSYLENNGSFVINEPKKRNDLTYYGEIYVKNINDIKNILEICLENMQNTPISNDIRVNIRFTLEQVNIIKRASKIFNLPYQSYIRETVLKRSIEDIKNIEKLIIIPIILLQIYYLVNIFDFI